MEAFKSGTVEKILYVPVIVKGAPGGEKKPDYIATVDCDPESVTFSQVIHRLPMVHPEDELHHLGWNACSSCYGKAGIERKHLIAPALLGNRIYVVDVKSNPREPKMHTVVEREEIESKTGMAYPHTVHCLKDGTVVISMLGGGDGDTSKNGYLVLDSQSGTFEVKGRWEKEGPGSGGQRFGYDFWYQPGKNVLVGSEWGDPEVFKFSFDPQHVKDGKYGSRLYFWDWSTRTLTQTIEMGDDGGVPLEVKMLHDPAAEMGFVCCALSSTMVRFFKEKENDKWSFDVPIRVEPVEADGWVLPSVPGLISAALISLDDKFLYFSNWLQGDVRQYDVSDPVHPKLTGRVFVGGVFAKGSGVTPTGASADFPVNDKLKVKGVTVEGGPQMLQLSLDGRRLYVTNSLFSPWDKQFYPDMATKGGCMLRIKCKPEGGMELDEDFVVDFGKEPDGPACPHEVRFPEGDCTSDIWY